MEIENQVCSLELAKKLKELGVKQESLFWWVNLNSIPYVVFHEGKYWGQKNNKYSAFTVAELGEMLPLGTHSIHIGSRVFSKEREWQCNLSSPTIGKHRKIFYGFTEADARAKMLIYLIENKLLTL